MKNILELLERCAEKHAEKIAYKDENQSLTYGEVLQKSRALGTAIARLGVQKTSAAILLDKTVFTPAAMFGILYAGCFYCVMDSKSPSDRLKNIENTLKPSVIVTDEEHLETAKEIGSGKIITIENAFKETPDDELLDEIRANQIDTDPAYALFTSGSTGTPKGTIVSHLNVLKYSLWLTETFGYNENTVLGNQTPFYFSMSVSDIYGALRACASVVIIPKKFFSFPVKLLEFLNENDVNTIYWVPSALSIVANWKALDYVEVPKIKKVLFAGEVMPTKQLNVWIEKLGGGVMFANLFGPTETTDICCYYIVNRKLRNDESVPIGTHCNNCECMIIKEDGTAAAPGEEGELYVRGSFVAGGYYNNPGKTAEAFVQNPLNSSYPETVYKSGDLVKLNEYGEMIYISRKDFQIKHMGYRIELGEIEAAASSAERMNYCACIYDKEKDAIVLIYNASRLKPEALREYLQSKVPAYMMPEKIIKISEMPFNANGKIDRKKLKEIYSTSIE